MDTSYFTSSAIASDQELVGPVNVLYSAEGDVELQKGFSTEVGCVFEVNHDRCPE